LLYEQGMRFPPSFLEDIRGRVSISSVVGRRVAWDRRKTNAGKGDYWACCPFHNEKTPSFHVEDRKGRYHCFGCKKSGDIFTFLVEKEGVPFPEAVAQLASEAGLIMPDFSEQDTEREQKRLGLYEVMELATKFFEAELQSARGSKARGYLSDRQLPVAVQREFRMGYAPDDKGALRSHLAALNVSAEQMIEAGLLISGEDIPVAYDRFRDRVMFPIRDPRGRVIAFGGRALKPDAPAKYLNSPETPLFHKGQVLYNHDKARGAAHEEGRIVAVEGYMDVIAVSMAGVAEVVAPLGTALTEDQLGLLWKAAAEPVLCFDGDAAGLKAAYRALDLALPLLKPGYSLSFALLPEGQDPDDLLKSEGPEAVKAVLRETQPLSDMLWRRALSENDRSTPERKAAFERDLRRQLGQIGDETVRKHYLSDLQQRLAGLFQQPAQRRNYGSRTAGYDRNRNLFLKRGQRPWEVAQPASPALRAASQRSGGRTTERREQLIALCLINHPALVPEFLDEFSGLDLLSHELDSLRSHLINTAALEPGLDTAGLKGHLQQRGFGPLLDRLTNQAMRLNEWYLGPEAADDDARTGLRQMFALHRKTVTLDRELKAAEAAFGADPSEANFNTLAGLREQLLSALGNEAQIEGFGAASGRSSDNVG
jgi:DNA primase